MRIHELAKELDVKSRDLVEALEKMGYGGLTASSSVPEEAVPRLRASGGKAVAAGKPKVVTEEPLPKPRARKAAPAKVAKPEPEPVTEFIVTGTPSIRMALLESRPRLGGRASSFVDRATGTRIDNCQHVSMGCCTNFRHFCETVGLGELLRSEPELYFVGPDGTANRFAAGPLPAPLHLLFAFRRLSYLSRADLRGIAKGLRALVRTGRGSNDSQPFDEWLRSQSQTPAAIERFWHVVLVSALSETLDRIDTGHARKVFVDGFLANRRGWQVQIPTVPLDELYGTRLVEWLARRGATVRVQAGVERVVVEGERAVAVELRSGEWLQADDFIIAVPHHLALALLPEPLRTHPDLAGIARLESAPISSVHLWFDRPITSLPHAVFVDRLSQWIFNRSALTGDRAGNTPLTTHHSPITTRSSSAPAAISPAGRSRRRSPRSSAS
jgi:squalene-associated FAD-dependent desaturase